MWLDMICRCTLGVREGTSSELHQPQRMLTTCTFTNALTLFMTRACVYHCFCRRTSKSRP